MRHFLVMVEGKLEAVYDDKAAAEKKLANLREETKHDLPGDNQWDMCITEISHD